MTVQNFMIGLKINNEFVFPRFTSENIENHLFSGGEVGMVIVSRRVTY